MIKLILLPSQTINLNLLIEKKIVFFELLSISLASFSSKFLNTNYYLLFRKFIILSVFLRREIVYFACVNLNKINSKLLDSKQFNITFD